MRRLLVIGSATLLLVTAALTRGDVAWGDDPQPPTASEQLLGPNFTAKPPVRKPAKADSQPTSATKPAPRRRFRNPQAIAEIIRVRENMGSLVQGTVLDSTGDAGVGEFADSLDQVIDQTPKPPAPQPPRAPVTQPIHVPADVMLVASLRQTARLLDSRANDFEDQDAFDQADKTRELANSLRIEARGLIQRSARSLPQTKNSWR